MPAPSALKGCRFFIALASDRGIQVAAGERDRTAVIAEGNEQSPDREHRRFVPRGPGTVVVHDSASNNRAQRDAEIAH